VANRQANKLLQRAKDSPYGWTRNEIDKLYKSFGFIINRGNNHDIVKHPELSNNLKGTLTRSSGELHPDYVRHAVKLIEILLSK
jgi:hypothetical protein